MPRENELDRLFSASNLTAFRNKQANRLCLSIEGGAKICGVDITNGVPRHIVAAEIRLARLLGIDNKTCQGALEWMRFRHTIESRVR